MKLAQPRILDSHTSGDVCLSLQSMFNANIEILEVMLSPPRVQGIPPSHHHVIPTSTQLDHLRHSSAYQHNIETTHQHSYHEYGSPRRLSSPKGVRYQG